MPFIAGKGAGRRDDEHDAANDNMMMRMNRRLINRQVEVAG